MAGRAAERMLLGGELAAPVEERPWRGSLVHFPARTKTSRSGSFIRGSSTKSGRASAAGSHAVATIHSEELQQARRG